MSAYIYNCKRCKIGRRVEYPIRVQAYPRAYFVREECGRRVSPGVWTERCGGGKPTVYGGDPLGVCATCGHAMTYDALKATTNAQVKCDARCMGARGHCCDCSCGGKNHGAGWSQLGAPLASLVAA